MQQCDGPGAGGRGSLGEELATTIVGGVDEVLHGFAGVVDEPVLHESLVLCVELLVVSKPARAHGAGGEGGGRYLRRAPEAPDLLDLA